MSKSKFIKATSGPKGSVIYESKDGRKFCYSKGNWTWRNNNPGNLVPGEVSKRNGAIGKAGGFAIFPDYATGHQALLDLLKNTYYKEFNLKEVIDKYAPKDGGNDVENYVRFLRKKTGVTDDKKVKDFTKDEFEKLWKAIEQMEGQQKGEIKECTEKKPDKEREKSEKLKIIGIQRNKTRTIISYLIETIGWVSKAQGIALTRQGKVDAVIAHSRSGNAYLRTRPDDSIEDNLDWMS